MAKWGEGDPRWIVEERPDATNVNNWHWTEKNATQWSKDKLSEVLLNTVIDDEKIGTCKISEISKCEGEATASNRKAKIIFFYEWELKLTWIANVNGDDEEIKGNIEILNLSEENKADEIDIEVTTSSSGDSAMALKEMVRVKGLKIIQNKLKMYIDGLVEEFSAGMILPKKGDETGSIKNTTEPKKKASLPTVNNITSAVKSADIKGLKLETVKYTSKQTFKCRASELYKVFTINEMVQAFTRGPAMTDAKVGGNFQMLSGNVTGKFINLVPDKKIVMSWRLKSWPVEHYSMVHLELDEKEDCTELNLTQSGIPSSAVEMTKAGWSRYYWESIKATFGFGAILT